MLHKITHGHDAHHEQLVRISTETLRTACNDGKRHVLLAASGSITIINLVQIIKGLSAHNLSIRVILTGSAVHFLAGQSREQPTLSAVAYLPNVDAVYTDASEWAMPWKCGAPILHIALRKWADVLVIAPLTANTMAKMVNGMCDNLLTSVVRAWDATGTVDGVKKKIVVAPSMNTAMWQHPVTSKQIKTLEEEWGGENGWIEVLRPIEKELACGDVEEGAMVGWEKIVEVIEAYILARKLAVDGNYVPRDGNRRFGSLSIGWKWGVASPK
ncbi:flavoprotein [Dactylonectria macrodidyma]|uniref:Flavoprotein n=1 Tax=Dactylonectria macrodidyma TaxID=307937 RepID=A0A9P9EVF9_9HYPO|nr:flavoprotein [Dactylonectria macrodidyma]